MPRGLRFAGTGLSLAIIAVVGWLDVVSAPELGLSLLYLIVIAICGWFIGLSSALVTALAAGAAWAVAHFATAGANVSIAISVWNAFTRVVIYVGAGVMLALLRRDRDILRAYAAREALLARSDAATGLPNSRGFFESVEAKLERAREEGAPVAVIYIDLDNFKSFNDHLGHAAGDDVLAEVARVLSTAASGSAVAARIGGDEFALFIGDVSAAEARETADRIRAGIAEIAASFPTFGFGATAGVAHFASAPSNADDLVRAADDAMYAGKTRGKGTTVLEES